MRGGDSFRVLCLYALWVGVVFSSEVRQEFSIRTWQQNVVNADRAKYSIPSFAYTGNFTFSAMAVRGEQNGTVDNYDAGEQGANSSFRLGHPNPNFFALSTDAKDLAVTFEGNDAVIFFPDLKLPGVTWTLRDPTLQVGQVAIRPGTDRIATVWQWKKSDSGDPAGGSSTADKRLSVFQFSESGVSLLSSLSYLDDRQLFPVDEIVITTEPPKGQFHPKNPERYLAHLSGIWLYDIRVRLNGSSEVTALKQFDLQIRDFSISPTGKYFAIIVGREIQILDGNTIELLDVVNFSMEMSASENLESPVSLCWSNRDRYLAIGKNSNGIKVCLHYPLPSRECLQAVISWGLSLLLLLT